jgi:hypothetical protein
MRWESPAEMGTRRSQDSEGLPDTILIKHG